MNYSDEYDGYDDVYGHSVEDDYCISPSDAAQFLYDREGSRGQQKISSFMKTDEDIAEEDESVDKSTEFDQARLNSCVEQIKSILEMNLPHNDMVKIILHHDYDVDASINEILSSKEFSKKIQKDKPECETPSIKVVASDSKANIKKGFEIQQKELFKNLTPRSQSPASRSDSPIEKVIEMSEEIKDGKHKKSSAHIAAEYSKTRGGSKQHLYMVVIGHVDAGKSTLMGHLLCALGQVNKNIF